MFNSVEKIYKVNEEMLDELWIDEEDYLIKLVYVYICLFIFCIGLYSFIMGISLRLRSERFLALDSELNFSSLVVCTSYIYSCSLAY